MRKSIGLNVIAVLLAGCSPERKVAVHIALSLSDLFGDERRIFTSL